LKYDIYLCKKCGGVCAGRQDATTYTCCYCRTRNSAKKSLRLVGGVEPKDVPDTIGRLKMARAGKHSTLK
jgi:hypothetical protein